MFVYELEATIKNKDEHTHTHTHTHTHKKKSENIWAKLEKKKFRVMVGYVTLLVYCLAKS